MIKINFNVGLRPPHRTPIFKENTDNTNIKIINIHIFFLKRYLRYSLRDYKNIGYSMSLCIVIRDKPKLIVINK